MLPSVCFVLASTSGAQADEPAIYVGSSACAGCHASETAAWRGSHHDLAMQEATDKSVLGNFDNATFTYGDVTSRFFKRDGKFFVNTDGPDGKLADFEIRYTFGIYPLQQYLIAFPDGRMQALGIAWDARPEDKGGRRWFHLYPGQHLRAGDPLHWTGLDQTWNFMCAECHSTELRKNYDAAKNAYATTWAEIDVACEACHGPGSAHVAWAKRQKSALPWAKGGDDGLIVHFDERKNISWTIDPATGNGHRSTPRTSAKELETCGMCHSRSAKIAEPWRPGQQLLDTHLPSLLQPGLFEADGKSLDEVYNYAPFRQSKMFMAAVSCSDCHDPHSLKLVADGNAVCEQCHDGQKYAAASHHHHADGSAGARCVACHMPVKTYMQVDARHDHAFRVPRPDESVRFGTSNACNDCHTDKNDAWAAAAVERWFGPERKGFQTWTETFAATRADKVEANALLLKLATSSDAPSIARATAFESLAEHPSREAVAAAQRDLSDADPLVRLAALRTLQALPVEQSWPLARGLLTDPVRGVRIEAASLLSAMPQDHLSPADRDRLSRAIDDYVAAQRLNADRPESRVNLGNLYAQQGRLAEATAETWDIYLAHPELAAAVDVIFVNIHPYWDDQPVTIAADYVVMRYEQLKAAYPDKEVIISETGWPTAGDANSMGGLPSNENQEFFLRDFWRATNLQNISFFVFEAFDEPWKATTEPNGVGDHWGLYDSARQPKHDLVSLIPMQVMQGTDRQDVISGKRSPSHQKKQLRQ